MKTFRILNAIISGVILTFLAMSCDSNEPEPDGPIEIPTYKPDNSNKIPDPEKAIINFDGERLFSLNDFNIEYDKKFVKRIYDGERFDGTKKFNPERKILFNYPEGNFYIHDSYRAESFSGILQFNERGYLSHLERYYYYAGGGHTWGDCTMDTIKIDFSYNDKGYLRGYTTNEKNVYYYYNKTSEYNEDSSLNTYGLYPTSIDIESITSTESLLEWEDGNITKMTVTGMFSDSDGKTEEINKSYHVHNNSQKNEFLQYPLFFSQELMSLTYPLNIMATMGLLGKGPNMLPSKITLSDYSSNVSDDKKEKTVGTMEYILSSNGSIKSEKIEATGNYYFGSSSNPNIYKYEYSK